MAAFGAEGYGEDQLSDSQQGNELSLQDQLGHAGKASGILGFLGMVPSNPVSVALSAANLGLSALDIANLGWQGAVNKALGTGWRKDLFNFTVGAPPNKQVMWPTSYGWDRGDPDPDWSEAQAEGVAGIDTSSKGTVGAGEHSHDPEGAWTDEQITSWNAAGQPPGMTQAQAQQRVDQAITDSEAESLGYGKGYDLSQEGLGYGWGQGAADDAADEDMGFGVDSGWARGGHVRKYAGGDLVQGEDPPSLSDPRTTVSDLLRVGSMFRKLGLPYDPRVEARGLQGKLPGDFYDRASGSFTLKGPGGVAPDFHAFASGKRLSDAAPLSLSGKKLSPYDEAGFRVSRPLGPGQLSFQRKWANVGPEGNPVPSTPSDRLSLNNPYGIPLSAFYQVQELPGGGQSRIRGGSVAAGPVTVSGSQEGFSKKLPRGVFGRKTSNIGASARMPVGKRGIMKAGVARQRMKDLYNQFLLGRREVIDYKGGYGYKGHGDGSSYGVTALRRNVKDGPGSTGLEAFYNMVNPLGLGGRLGLTGSAFFPDRGRNAAQLMARYRMRY